jgi:hypothetical protein
MSEYRNIIAKFITLFYLSITLPGVIETACPPDRRLTIIRR